MPITILKPLAFSAAMSHVHEGAAFVDMRQLDEYLDVHIPASLALQYEFGPGFASRARDILPLEVPLILLDLGTGDVAHAAASLKGKGFNVLGAVEDGINAWSELHGTPASTEIYRGPTPTHTTVLDVGDPGAVVAEGALSVPIEHLWRRLDEIENESRVTIAAGYGLRAALAIGVLERVEVDEIVFWKTRE
ncbi:MAG: hydroxyacylglutathione hydrolase [Actinomycetota bacterium]|jgi:rhodanese-related sulfurtransferase|nr:hydroxyacylglutathione hydrolase [Actinomycetota bacterium]